MFVAIRGASSRVSNFSADPLNPRFADWLNMLRKFWSFLVQLFESREIEAPIRQSCTRYAFFFVSALG
jgi:hypothetical protein